MSNVNNVFIQGLLFLKVLEISNVNNIILPCPAPSFQGCREPCGYQAGKVDLLSGRRLAPVEDGANFPGDSDQGALAGPP